MRSRSIRLLSGVSAVAIIAGLVPAYAADTISGPATTDPYTNAEVDSVTINLDATIRADATTNDSFINPITMNDPAANLIVNDSTLLGDIVNSGTMISSAGTAITILNDSQIFGQIENAGLISGSLIGLSIVDDSTVAGGILNSGTIGAGTTAILIGDDSELLGGITNSGRIAGGAGIYVNDAQAELWGGIHNQESGEIVGGTIAAIALSGAIYEGGITNAGTITGQTSADGISMTGGIFNGDIDSSGIIQVTAINQTAIAIGAGTFNGGISNSGQILAEVSSAVAIQISGATDFNGNITNTSSGIIRADSTAVVVSNATFDGNISNSGEITSHSNIAIVVSTTSFTGNIVNDGDITSESSSAIIESATTFTGDIDNQLGGTINAVFAGVRVTSNTFTGNFTNAGSIVSSSSDAVVIDAVAFTGNFTNSGELDGLDNGVVFAGAAFTGPVSNSGQIVAGNNAVVVDLGTTITGSVTNSGSIESTSADAISVVGAIVGPLTNAKTGTIHGDRDGIAIDGSVSGVITNQGTIIGETGAGIDLSGSAATHTVTQSEGLLRGGDGGVTIGTALRMNNVALQDTFNANGGTIDGNIVGGATNIDDVIMTPDDASTVVYLRGTASNIDHFDKQGAGTAILGAASRGSDTGVGVIINAVRMDHGGEGSLYLDDNTDINLSGAYTQTDGTLEYFLTDDTSTHGTINAATAALGSRRLAAFVDPDAFAAAGGAGGVSYTYQDVITGTISGILDGDIVDTNSLFFEGEADVHAADVDIILTRLSFSDALLIPGLTRNQAAVGGAIETIFGNAGYGSEFEDLYAYLFSLPAGSEEDVQHLYDELAGAELADTQEIGLRLNHAFDNTIGERLDDLRSSHANSHSASLGLRRYAEADPMVASDSMPAEGSGLRGAQNVGIWAQAYGDWTDSKGDVEAAGYDQDSKGIAGGVDAAVSKQVHVGAAVGWSNADADFATPGDTAEIDAFHAAVYAAVESGQFFADAVLTFAAQDVKTARELDLGFGTFDADASYNANAWNVHGEAGWTFSVAGGKFEPFAALHYALLSTDSFAETGAGAYNLIVEGQDADSLSSNLGARFSGNWTDGGIRYIPSLEVAWRHEFMDERQSILAAFEEDPSTRFQIVSSALAQDSAAVKAGIGAEISQGLVVFLDYNGLYNSSATSHGATAGLRAAW